MSTVHCEEDELVCLLWGALGELGCVVAMRWLERERDLAPALPQELLFVRSAVLDGRWEEAHEVAEPLLSSGDGAAQRALEGLYEQELLDALHESAAGDGAADPLASRLAALERTLPAASFRHLCVTLSNAEPSTDVERGKARHGAWLRARGALGRALGDSDEPASASDDDAPSIGPLLAAAAAYSGGSGHGRDLRLSLPACRAVEAARDPDASAPHGASAGGIELRVGDYDRHVVVSRQAASPKVHPAASGADVRQSLPALGDRRVMDAIRRSQSGVPTKREQENEEEEEEEQQQQQAEEEGDEEEERDTSGARGGMRVDTAAAEDEDKEEEEEEEEGDGEEEREVGPHSHPRVESAPPAAPTPTARRVAVAEELSSMLASLARAEAAGNVRRSAALRGSVRDLRAALEGAYDGAVEHSDGGELLGAGEEEEEGEKDEEDHLAATEDAQRSSQARPATQADEYEEEEEEEEEEEGDARAGAADESDEAAAPRQRPTLVPLAHLHAGSWRNVHVETLYRDEKAVRCVAFQSARPWRLAMGNNTRCLRLLQPRPGADAAAAAADEPCAVVAEAEGVHRGSVYALAWRKARGAIPLLATGSNDKQVRVFAVHDEPTPSLAHAATGAGVGGTVRAVAFAGEGQVAGAGGGDHTVCLWSLRRLGEGGATEGAATWSQPQGSLPGHSGVVHALQWCSVTRRLFSASKDGTVRVWSPRDSDRPVVTLQAPGPATTLAVVPRADAVVAGDEGGHLSWWDIRRPGAPVQRSSHALCSGEGDTVRALALSPDEAWLCAGMEDGRIMASPAAPAALPSMRAVATVESQVLSLSWRTCREEATLAASTAAGEVLQLQPTS